MLGKCFRKLPLIAMSFGLLGVSSGSFADTLLVDDDRAQCPDAPYVTIQGAVNGASEDDEVRVCPGFYSEQVVVDKPIRIRGSGPKATRRTGDPTVESVLNGQPPVSGEAAIKVLHNFVKLSDMTIQNLEGSGIYTSPSASGYVRKTTICSIIP